MGPDRLHEEPRTTAAGRGVAEVHGQAAGATAGEAVAVGRPLLGRRHADRGVGLAQELQAQGWRGQRRRLRLSWPEAQERHACLDQRPQRQALPQGGWPRGAAELYGTCHHGKPQWPGRRRQGRRITVGEDKAYDIRDHIAALRQMNVTPHVAQYNVQSKPGSRRTSGLDKRTTRHTGYRISQTCRAMVECIFGWGKLHGTMRKTKHRGVAAVGADFMLNLIAYNLVRIPKLIAA